ncbi:MAG TPA: GNAT family N-acetyltransferase [Polyangiaceae bacterium]
MSGAALVFTSATPGDARDIAMLHAVVAQHHQRAVPRARRWRVPPEKQIALWMKTTETLLAREGALLVATLRLDPARGFCGVAPFTEVDGFVYLLEMAVHPSHQRRGVGRLCLEEAERWARARGSKAIRLDTNDDAIRAAAFYAACGYREVLHHARTIYFERLL